MDVLVALAILAVVAGAVWVVAGPLRAPADDDGSDPEGRQAERDALEAAKESKYREIRDAELDRRTGKLDEADWKAVDRQLRAEAVAILRQLDDLGER